MSFQALKKLWIAVLSVFGCFAKWDLREMRDRNEHKADNEFGDEAQM